MKYDLSKTPQGYQQNPKGTNYLYGIWLGIVKEVIDDTQFMGRLKVWIPDFGGNEKDSKYWHIVSYCTPFGGATPVDKTAAVAQTYTDTQNSYGFWMVPPDTGNQVLITFAAGDIARGYWIGCVYQPYMNQMVPALGAATSSEGIFEPVAEYDKQEAVSDSFDIDNPRRVPFSPLADGLKTQGLINDTRRGVADTSARRESPSRAFGYSTPRGNTIHIDDGKGADHDNEFIRLRTRSGVGITIHETDGFVYIVSKNGKSYVEVSDDGVHLYSENSVNLRTSNAYNITSIGDLNIDCGGKLSIYASNGIEMGSPGDINIASNGNLIMGSTGNSSINAGADVLFSAGGIMGLGAAGNLILQGDEIQEGQDPPSAPTPIMAERHPMPDGPGGTEPGANIGAAMPHHEPYSRYSNDGVAGATGNPNQIKEDPNLMKRAAQYAGCINKAVQDLHTRHPDSTFVTPEYIMGVAYAESSFKQDAKAPSSSATGMFQFTDGTWKMASKTATGSEQPLNMRTDACYSAQVMADFTYQNGLYLKSHGVSDLSPANLYMAHFLGKAGAVKITQANSSSAGQSQPAVDYVSSAASHSNPSIFYSGGSPRTVGQVSNIVSNKVTSHMSDFAALNKSIASGTTKSGG